MADFTAGSTIFIIENNKYVSEATLVNISGDFCTIRFKDRDGGTRLRKSRIYVSREDAKKCLSRGRAGEGTTNFGGGRAGTHHKTQYDYMREHKL